MSLGKTLLGCLTAVALCFGMTAAANAQYGTYTEDFESGFTLGQRIGTHADWYDGGGGPVVNSGVGLGGSVGLGNASAIFTWVAHPFDFGDAALTKYVGKLDFETDGSGHFDDDRVGWMVRDNSTSSNYIFAAQLDPGGTGPTGYNIEGYWDHASFGDNGGRPSICNIPAVSANTFYRFVATFTKLTDTSCSIDVELWSLDGAGDPDTLQCSGSIADTSLLGSQTPMTEYFTADTIWPGYKNYTAAPADADNAYADIVPEPATLSLLGLGACLALWKRRRR